MTCNNGLRPTLATMPSALRRVYWVWAAMIQRCHNSTNKHYSRYGARGITVCERWRRSFDAFAADLGPRPAGWTLDRTNGALGYGPHNCCWVSRREQNANRPTWCIAVEVNGEPMRTLRDAVRTHGAPGLSYRAIHKRIFDRGWPVSLALVIPAQGIA